MNTNQKLSEADQQRRARQGAMSIAQFCNRYGLGRTTVYEEIKSGRLRVRKCGKRSLIIDDECGNLVAAFANP